MEKRVDLEIAGMHCASCALLVERSLKKVPGVKIAKVNYATEKAMVITEENVSHKLLKTAVEKAGYKIGQASKNELRNKFLIAAALSIPFLFPIPMWLMGGLALIVQIGLGAGFYKGAWSALKMHSFNMDSLVALGTTTVFIYSLISKPYFEIGVWLITFVTLGKWLEGRAKSKTSEAISKLVELQPKNHKIKVGDIILIRPGERIPVDGKIVKGSSAVDEAMITGESMPVDKNKGDTVTGGTMNISGSFEFEATRVGADTTLAKIIRLVEEAAGSKAPIQDFADRVAAWFVPAILMIALITLIITKSPMAFVAVLVIACPCALGLATPTAIIVGTGKGAENGILIKGGEPLEMAGKIDTVVFDKTGTLTTGKLQIVKVEGKILEVAGALERMSEHPVGKAIYEYAHKKVDNFPEVNNFKAVAGSGVTGEIHNKAYFLGRVADEEGIVLLQDNKKMGKFTVTDTIRTTSLEAVNRLKKMGIEVYLLSGDKQQTAEKVADKVGITEIIAEVKPDQKAEEIKKLQGMGKKVAMIGDGINDAPALAQADLGIAMGGGTDVAMESGGIVLLKNDPRDVVVAIKLAKATVRKIKQNLFFALFYNALGIPVAAGVFAGWGLTLNPEIAGLAMAASSVSVVTNSLLLKRWKN